MTKYYGTKNQTFLKLSVASLIVCFPWLPGYEPLAPPPPPSATAVPVWQDRTIASSKLRMLEYSAFMEVQRDPDTVSYTLLLVL